MQPRIMPGFQYTAAANDPSAFFNAVRQAQKSQLAGPVAQPQKKRRNFWLDQISTVGGIGGAALGTMVAPVFGTAAGGAIGSAAGEALENFIDPETGDWGNVAEEAVLGGIFAGGPLKLGKGALGAKTALQTGAAKGLGEALKIGGKEAASWTIRGAAGKGLAGKAGQLATKQFGLTDNFVAKFARNYGDDAGKVLNKYGITSEDDIAKAIAQKNQEFGALVQSAGNINRSAVQKKLYGIADDLMKQGPSQQKAIGQKLLGETDQLLKKYGDNIPATELNSLKSQYDSLVNYTMKQADPNTYGLNKRVADGLRETIQESAGKKLKSTGMELSKLHTLSDEIAARAPKVASRGSSPLGFRNLMGGAIGATAGGPGGAVVGAGLTAAANSPTARRIYTKTALSGAEKLAASGAKKAGQSVLRDQATRFGGKALLQGIAGNTTQAQTLDGALTEDYLGPMSNTDTTTNAMTAPAMSSTSMQSPYNSSDPLSSALTAQSPYSRENLMADIQRDPQNAENYIEYYKMLDEVFAPKGGGLELNNTAVGTVTDLQTGIDNLGLLEQRIMESGANNPVLGALRSKNPFDTEAKSLRAEIDRVKQVVGKALEGGVLRKEDEEKYARILPTINDTDAVAAQKISAIRADLQNKYNSFLANQSQYGGGGGLDMALMAQQGYAY